MTEQTHEVHPRDDSGRHLVVVASLLSVIFALLLSVGLGIVGSKAVTAGREAQQASRVNRQTLADNCVSANKSRALNVELWEYILTLNPQPTPDQKATAAKLLDFVRTTFAQQPCPAADG